MMYPTHVTLSSPDYWTLRTGSCIFGQLPTSLLFQEVREKRSLCYSIYSSILSYDGVMSVSTGIDSAHLDEVKELVEQQRQRLSLIHISRIDVPVLKDIPVLGEMFFKQVHPTFYLTIILVFVTWYVVFKTPFGLRMRSCGEFPQASASMGINVRRMRYFGVLVSGALAGLAGGVMVLTQDVQFTVCLLYTSN